MPLVRDYRNYSFQPARIDRCGRNIGSKLYWKLYAIENTVRIVIHSVLSAQIHPNWWGVAVDAKIIARAQGFRKSYAAKPKNTLPGVHDIHLVFVSDLTEIFRANSHLITPVVPTAAQWIVTLESIRVPRNVVGHMHFPNAYDRSMIDSAFAQLPSLIGYLTAYPVPITIPK